MAFTVYVEVRLVNLFQKYAFSFRHLEIQFMKFIYVHFVSTFIGYVLQLSMARTADICDVAKSSQATYGVDEEGKW